VSPADPVVADLDDTPAVRDLQPYPGAGDVRVLDDVGQRLGSAGRAGRGAARRGAARILLFSMIAKTFTSYIV